MWKTSKLPFGREHTQLTKEVNYKAVVVAVDVSGRIGLELNSDIGHGCVEFEVRPCAAVLAQDVARQVVTVVECQLVVLTQIETETKKRSHP